MNRLNIGIDIDGTVTEPFSWLVRANEYFGTNVTEDSISHYEYHKALGKTKQECELFYEASGEAIHREAKIRPGAQFVIRHLFLQHNIHFITAREERMRQISLDWLDEHQIPLDSISLLGHCDKVDRARELVCDLFIEDRYENAIQLARAGISVFLMDCRYNRGPLPANVKRVMNWYQISGIFREFAKLFSYQVAL